MYYAPPLGSREKKILLGSPVQVGGNNGLPEVDTHLRIPIVGTIVANTYSLLHCL